MRVITLTDDEFDNLLIMAGFATGAAMKQEDKRLANSFLRLVNSINRDNPNWAPYNIEDVEFER